MQRRMVGLDLGWQLEVVEGGGGGAGFVGDVGMSELAGGCCVDGVCVIDEVDDVNEAKRKALAITLMCRRWCG